MADKADKDGNAPKKRGKANDQGNGSYGAQDITVLEGLEAVRKRPGMYIGSTGARGLHHLIYEVMDNSVDEALAGEADHVEIVIHPDNSVTVTDNGRGIPVDTMEKEKRPAAEVVLTVLHAGGKFGDGGGYKVSGGLHGVGVSVVNALSEWLHLTVWRDGNEWTQSYERGTPTAELKKGGETDQRGTSITFLPDLEIFETIEYDRTVLEQRFREMAFLTKGLRSTSATSAASASRRPSSTTAASSTSSSTCTPRARASRCTRRSSTSRSSSDDRRGRGRAAVEQLLPGGAALVRQQHQHARGRLAPVRLPLGADAHDQRATRGRRACSRRRTRTSRARTCARASPRSSR